MPRTPFLGYFSQPTPLTGGESPTGNPATQHDAFLRRAYKKKTMELIPEHIPPLGKLNLFGILEDRVVAIQAIPLILDFLLFAQLVEGSAVDSLVGNIIRLMCESALGVLTKEGQFPPLKYSRHKPREILLLLLIESRIDGGTCHLNGGRGFYSFGMVTSPDRGRFLVSLVSATSTIPVLHGLYPAVAAGRISCPSDSTVGRPVKVRSELESWMRGSPLRWARSVRKETR